MNILQISSDRWQEYKALRLEALKNEPTAFGASYELAQNHTPEQWKEMVAKTTILVAEHNNALVGMVKYKRETVPKVAHTATIYGLYVCKEFRGQGIGKQLLLAAITALKNQHVEKVRLSATKKNNHVIQFYEKLGFETVGISKKEMKVENQYYDMVMMEKFI